MHPQAVLCLLFSLATSLVAVGQPYDFAAADDLLTEALPNLNNHVAVILRQDGVELYRFRAGDIGYDTQIRMASFTKTVSAGVILALVDEGLLALDERVGDTYPLFEASGIGDPTVLDAWAMRHGIETPLEYQRDPRFTLAESITRIGVTGYPVFAPGEQLGYDGAGMQVTGGIAQLRCNQLWAAIAQTRVFDACDMPQTDYGQFDPNPAVAGGLRSTAEESMNYAQMIIDGGWYAGQRVLSDAAIDHLFTNYTRGLPVFGSPWPAEHALYPYGVDPDYGFGGWVLAENPTTDHVEEIVGAGAWGSYLWIDRRRGLTAVLFTDVLPGSQASMTPALALCQIAREQVESAQVGHLSAVRFGAEVCLAWQAPPDALHVRVYGADRPIRDIFALRDATLLEETALATATVPPFAHYAVTAVFPALENTALVPGGNATRRPPPVPDLDSDGTVGWDDWLVLAGDLGNPGPGAPGDVDGDGATDLADVVDLQRFFGRGGCATP